MFNSKQLIHFYKLTLKEANFALEKGNYPIGSIIVNSKGEVLVSGQNENNTTGDISAHAEIQCLRKLGMGELSKDTGKEHYLFTSLEPCGGCTFFIARTNIKKVYAIVKDSYREGISGLKKSKEFKEYLSNLEYEISEDGELMKQSKQLMSDYMLQKGQTEKAKIFSN